MAELPVADQLVALREAAGGRDLDKAAFALGGERAEHAYGVDEVHVGRRAAVTRLYKGTEFRRKSQIPASCGRRSCVVARRCRKKGRASVSGERRELGLRPAERA